MVSAATSLRVGNTNLPRVTLADVQPGDIGFQYQPSHRNFRQFWITTGGHIANMWRKEPTDPFVVHAFVVVKAHPNKKQIHTVDGAGGNYRDIDEVRMDFKGGAHVVPRAKYFFYRPTDPAMAQSMVKIARNWAAPGMRNFSVRRAAVSPFHSVKMHSRDRRDALVLLAQAGIKAPPKTQPGGTKLYRMMCSEFVACVCQAATLRAWKIEQPKARAPVDVLRGLQVGPMDNIFAVDCEGATPPFLQARFEASKRWMPVGYVSHEG